MKKSMHTLRSRAKAKKLLDTHPKELELDAVIKSINNSLSIAQARFEGVTLNDGSITLQTTSTKAAGGGFKLFVRAEKRWSKGTSNSVTYKYKKPDTKDVKTDVQDKLALIIISAAEQYKTSTSITGLEKDGFEVVLSLSITNISALGIEFEIFGVGFDANADFDKTVFHSITLSFSTKG